MQGGELLDQLSVYQLVKKTLVYGARYLYKELNFGQKTYV
jgi:hypothetical protein